MYHKINYWDILSNWIIFFSDSIQMWVLLSMDTKCFVENHMHHNVLISRVPHVCRKVLKKGKCCMLKCNLIKCIIHYWMQDTALDFFFIIIITWNVTTLILHIYFNVRLVSDDFFFFLILYFFWPFPFYLGCYRYLQQGCPFLLLEGHCLAEDYSRY